MISSSPSSSTHFDAAASVIKTYYLATAAAAGPVISSIIALRLSARGILKISLRFAILVLTLTAIATTTSSEVLIVLQHQDLHDTTPVAFERATAVEQLRNSTSTVGTTIRGGGSKETMVLTDLLSNRADSIDRHQAINIEQQQRTLKTSESTATKESQHHQKKSERTATDGSQHQKKSEQRAVTEASHHQKKSEQRTATEGSQHKKKSEQRPVTEESQHQKKSEQRTATEESQHQKKSESQHQHHHTSKEQVAVPTFGLVVAHCAEDFLAPWVNDVDKVTLLTDHRTVSDGAGGSVARQKTSWDVTVYERCDQRAHANYSVPQENLGSEECSAYVQYVLDRYDDLPEIVYFLQPDALAPNNMKDDKHQHTSFNTMQTLVDASAPLLMKNGGRSTSGDTDAVLGYLNLGSNMEIIPKVVMEEDSKLVEILSLMGERAPHYDAETRLGFVSSACFAVRRERILANPREFYEDLMKIIHRYAPENECLVCWALESSWHVVMGEPLQVPKNSTLAFRSETA